MSKKINIAYNFLQELSRFQILKDEFDRIDFNKQKKQAEKYQFQFQRMELELQKLNNNLQWLTKQFKQEETGEIIELI